MLLYGLFLGGLDFIKGWNVPDTKTDIQKVISEIQEEVNNTLLLTAETVPFDVQVRVETIL